jgi:hypothetical protein
MCPSSATNYKYVSKLREATSRLHAMPTAFVLLSTFINNPLFLGLNVHSFTIYLPTPFTHVHS